MGRHAVIDIGTNSIKMHAAELAQGRVRVLADVTEITRLGEGLHETGLIGQAAQERNAEAIAAFMAKGRKLGVDDFVAVGTMALRSAVNAAVFLDLVRERCGLAIEIIPGEEEARLSYLAVLSGLGRQEGRVCVFDAGGGSTEFIFGEGDRIERRFSLDVGSRLSTEKFLSSDPVAPAEFAQLCDQLAEAFDGLGMGVDTLVGMGGTVTSLGAVMHEMTDYDPDLIQGSVLGLVEVKRQIDLYLGRSIEERRSIRGLMPERADLILTGAVIVKAIMLELGVDALIISDRGLRHGVMFDRFIRGSGN